jgi:hypothetical protein
VVFREAKTALYPHSGFHCFSFSFEQCVSIRKVMSYCCFHLWKISLPLISSDAKPLQLAEAIVRLAIDIANNIYFTDIRTSNNTYNHTNYEQNQNYSIQILNIKHNHSRTDNANQTKQHGYEKYKPYPPWNTLHHVWKYVTFGSQQRNKNWAWFKGKVTPQFRIFSFTENWCSHSIIIYLLVVIPILNWED